MPDSLHLVHFDCAPMVGISTQMNIDLILVKGIVRAKGWGCRGKSGRG